MVITHKYAMKRNRIQIWIIVFYDVAVNIFKTCIILIKQSIKSINNDKVTGYVSVCVCTKGSY